MDSKYPILDNISVPKQVMTNWQKTADLLARLSHVPAALIMRVHSKEIEVFITSDSEGNVYEEGEKAPLDTGLYCETVMDTQKKLLIPNALKDPDWDKNPDIDLGMISYCGLPLTWPTGDVFGTICILDKKENAYSRMIVDLMERFKDSLQFGLATIYENESIKTKYQKERSLRHYAATKHKLAKRELREKEIELGVIIENLPSMVFVKDAKDLRYIKCNRATEQLLGIPREELIGKKDHDFLPQHQADSFVKNDREVLTSGEVIDIDIEPIKTPQGNRLVHTKKVCIHDASGKAKYLLGISEDVTERVQADKIIKHQANYDSLTDLPNRHLLFDRLNQSLALCRRHGHFGAILFIDLDNFKNINDSLGHPIGDKVLCEVANRLRKIVRTEDTLSRLGGDEFVVSFSELSDNAERAAKMARLGAEKLQSALAVPFDIDGHQLHLTSSIGIAPFPLGDESTDDILRHADTAMYRAKDSGKNTVQFYLPSMQHAAEARLNLQNALQRAISNDEFRLFYQSKVDKHGKTVGCEALIRWTHPETGNVPPNEFIPVAEDTGQILRIGNWVLETGLNRLKDWSDQHQHIEFNIAINVSPHQFYQPDFIQHVQKALKQSGADPRRLTLEMTEGVFIGNLEDAIAKMNALRQMGIRISIDDFGTGYSSLSYLKNLPVDELKIDHSFVRDIIADASDAKLVETIITMARQFDIDIVAEGVETTDQYEFLRAKGCDYYQGYLFSKPLPEQDFEALLAKAEWPRPYRSHS